MVPTTPQGGFGSMPTPLHPSWGAIRTGLSRGVGVSHGGSCPVARCPLSTPRGGGGFAEPPRSAAPAPTGPGRGG